MCVCVSVCVCVCVCVCVPSCRESNECRDCSDVRNRKSGPALFSYPLHFAPATKRYQWDWTYCTVHTASFIDIPFTQTGDTFQAEFALARKTPWSDWNTAQSAQRSSNPSHARNWEIPTRVENLAQPV